MKPALSHAPRHPHVALVPYRRAYTEPFMRWRTQPSTVRHNPLLSLGAKEIERQLRAEGSDLTRLRKHKSYRWFVESEGTVVGNVSLKSISHRMQYGEIGYGFGQDHHGRGLATAAVGMLVDKVFAETDLRKLLAYVHDENHASCRVLEKLGFQREGFLREHYVINEKPVNEILFALLKRDWLEHRAASQAHGPVSPR
jgi:RimJ/RimL family protein N-acetyltransferase